MLKRLKILIAVIALSLVVYSPQLYADENYTANECFEKFSRGTLKFNQGLDKAIFKPIAKGYRALPNPIRTGTSNFVSNLRSLLTLSNNVLQGDFKGAGNTVGRFTINTTLGILGVFDPASKWDLKKEVERFWSNSWSLGSRYRLLFCFAYSWTNDSKRCSRTSRQHFY